MKRIVPLVLIAIGLSACDAGVTDAEPAPMTGTYEIEYRFAALYDGMSLACGFHGLATSTVTDSEVEIRQYVPGGESCQANEHARITVRANWREEGPITGTLNGEALVLNIPRAFGATRQAQGSITDNGFEVSTDPIIDGNWTITMTIVGTRVD